MSDSSAARQLLGMKGASGTVKGFKMTDGSGVGVVVELSDGSSGWFFPDEIAAA